jgi:dienelactone hydrolase
MVRSFLDAFCVEGAEPPFNTVQLRAFYPAAFDRTKDQLDTGVIPAASASPRSGWPIIVFLQGVNIASFTYHWFARILASRGFVVVLPEWMAQNLKSRTSFTPGIKIDALKAGILGHELSGTALPGIWRALAKWQATGVLAGTLDLSAIFLGGHSAGGTLALLNSRASWLPGLVGSFAIFSNVLATMALGAWPKGSVPPLSADVPMLMIGAERDCVSAHHIGEFGRDGETPVELHMRAFREGVSRTSGDSHAVILQGATHHSICHPVDDTLGRTFLEDGQDHDAPGVRETLVEAVCVFAEGILDGDAGFEKWLQMERAMRPQAILAMETK